MCHVRNSCSGFSLLEVLVALVIIAGSLLAIVALQNLSLRQVHAAYYQTLAMSEVSALMEQFRADPSPAGLSQSTAWMQDQITHLLPEGRCEYQCSGPAEPCSISIFWRDHGQQNVQLSSLI